MDQSDLDILTRSGEFDWFVLVVKDLPDLSWVAGWINQDLVAE